MVILPMAPLLLLTAQQVAPVPIVVERDKFYCLADYAGSFIGHGPRIALDLSTCPPIMVNYYTAWPRERVSTVIRLTEPQLRCIRSHRGRLGSIVYDRHDGTIELRLQRCPRR